MNIIVSQKPVVFQRDGKVFANSKDVAAFFEKKHFHVLRDIRELISKSPELLQTNFGCNEIKDLTGTSTESYDMDRTGFTLLAMGFTGAKALEFKVRYIRQYNEMEAALAQPQYSIPTTFAEALRLAAELQDAIDAKDSMLKITAPKAKAYDLVADSDGLLGLQEASRSMGWGANRLSKKLKEAGVLFFQNGGLQPSSELVTKGLLKLVIRTVNGRTYTQVRVTPKGLMVFAKKWG